MARQRVVKPEFFRDRKIAKLGPVPALVYQALWIMADDGGNAPAAPDLVHGEMFSRWKEITVEEVGRALLLLSEASRIVLHQNGDEIFAVIPNLAKHQNINRPSAFRHDIGEPVSDAKSTLCEFLPFEDPDQTQLPLSEGSRSNTNTITNTNTREPPKVPLTKKPRRKKSFPDYTPEYEQFWEAHPAKQGKREGFEPFLDALKRASFEEIMAGAHRYRKWFDAMASRNGDTTKPKYPQGWLNNNRWEDECEIPTPRDELDELIRGAQ